MASKTEAMDSAAASHGVSDLDVVARYAEIEITSVAAQFASTTVDGAKAPPAAIAKAVKAEDEENEDSDDSEHDDDEEMKPSVESSDDDDSSSDEDESTSDHHGRLRAQIEAAMEKEENRAAAELLKTEHEIVEVPVREPSVKELAPDCPIALCGSIMNVSVAGLMITIKSNPGNQPLDEGSVLCLEDRTVIGAVDEVFGPVQMPLYLVRFQTADKIPAQAKNGVSIYYATEHTTYIVPEQIKDKGTDASNLYDEETDEVAYSDDEAEAAAKRQAKRKRNRGGNGIPVEGTAQQPIAHNQPRPSNFSDYHAPHPGRDGAQFSGRGGRGGRGRGSGRGFGRGGRGRGGFTNYPPPYGPPNGFAPGYGPPPHGFQPPFPGQVPPFDPRMMHPIGTHHHGGFHPHHGPPLPPGPPGQFFPHPPPAYPPPPHYAPVPPYLPQNGAGHLQPGYQQQPPLPPLPPTDP